METTNCPYCAEEIKKDAKKCKHCGEFIDQELRKEQAKQKSSAKPQQVVVKQKTSGWVTFLVILACIALLIMIIGF